jgi:hypothetical protein
MVRPHSTWVGMNDHCRRGMALVQIIAALRSRAPHRATHTLADLWKAKVIVDPMEPHGDYNTAWAGRTSWSYKRQFSKAQLGSAFGAGADVLLVAEGLEGTNATLQLLNGVQVLSADGMWLRYTRPVIRAVLQPANALEVRFHSVHDGCAFSNPISSNRTCPDRGSTRQSAGSWGRGWAGRCSPQGAWRPICSRRKATASSPLSAKFCSFHERRQLIRAEGRD